MATEIKCEQCEIPIGFSEMGAAYWFVDTFLCEKHWVKAAGFKRVKEVREAELELKSFNTRRRRNDG